MKILIRKGNNSQIAKHFKESEFYCKQPTKEMIGHAFYTELIEAVSYLREHYDVPWRITSTYRPGNGQSQHGECRAIDSQDTASYKGHTSETMIDLVGQILDPTSEIFTNLRRIGITGFGVYDTFVHLDCRDTSNAPAGHSDNFGKYAAWDNRTERGKALQPDDAKKKGFLKSLPPKKPTLNLTKAPASPVPSSR